MTGGRRPVEARGTVLTHEDMRGRNTFDRPDEVRPTPLPVSLNRDAVQVQLPPHSVAALEVRAS
jgi:alpha-L-arabinofuranosidase